MKHICTNCKKQFKQKNDLKRHLEKKNSCKTLLLINKEQNSINEVHSIFKSILDILRNDSAHITGERPLFQMSYFIILKMAEIHIDNGIIDIDNLDYYKPIDMLDDKLKEFLALTRFSNLVKFSEEKREDGTEKWKDLKRIMDEVLINKLLSKHPKFKNIFSKSLEIKDSRTIRDILKKLKLIDFNKYSIDILGEAYEAVFMDTVYGTGKGVKNEFGNFFTPPAVKNLLINLVKPSINEKGEIETFMDPSCGTGGIINTLLRYYQKISNEDQLKTLRKEFINKIYGIELLENIFNLCNSNMLINTGEILTNVICADALKQFHNIAVKIICANPPFSVKINYEDLQEQLLDNIYDYIPINAGGKNSEVLFIQMMIHCLEINGRCSTVMLDGQKIYGNSSNYNTVREYLMKSCDLKEVIYCPSGTFTSTNSKTCVLFFVKKKIRADVLTITGTSKNPKYEFVKSHSTKKVKFFDFNEKYPETDNKRFIMDVDIKDIASNNYSLNYSDYVVESEEEEDVNDNFEWKILGEIFDLLPTTKHYTSIGKDNGQYRFYNSSQNGKKLYLDNYEIDKDSLIIGNGGCANIHIDTSFTASKHVTVAQLNKEFNNSVLKYFYYYLINNLISLDNKSKGAGLQWLNKANMRLIKIRVPSIELQQTIVDFLDGIFDNKDISIQDVSSYYEGNDIFDLLLNEKYDLFLMLVKWYTDSINLNKQIDFYKEKQSNFLKLSTRNYETKTLGEVCEFKNGKGLKKNTIISGSYPVIGGGIKPFGYHNKYNRDKNTILCSSSGAGAGYISKYERNVWASDCFSITPKSILLNDYLFIFLIANQTKIYSIRPKQSNRPHMYSKNISVLNINVPSVKLQQIIIDYCDSVKKRIECLKNEIEEHSNLANKYFFENVLDDSSDDGSEIELTSDSDSDDEDFYTETDLKKKTISEIKDILKESDINFESKDKKAVLIQKYLDA